MDTVIDRTEYNARRERLLMGRQSVVEELQRTEPFVAPGAVRRVRTQEYRTSAYESMEDE